MSIDNKYVEELDDETVTLELDDGVTVECDVLAIFPANKRSYVALLPTSGPDSEDGNVYLYRYSENEKGEPEISNIESDEEFNIASNAYNTIFFSDEEYDELVDAEDVE